ncbi:MAG: DUF2334 domain-containing protein [Cytophagaceae bacterium]|nr:DUF2334 domain-containing protein [Gemmatimonadaceae bacterium]
MTCARRYVVEVHDVSATDPSMAQRLLDCAPADAARRAAILIVPNWGGRAPVDAGNALSRSLGRAGATRVLHGYTHSLGRSLLNAIWFGTDDEGEFARLDAVEAARRLTSGMEIFSRAFGGTPEWFCAPRWQASAASRRAVRRARLGLLDRDEIVTHDGRRIASPVVWFDDGVRLAARVIGSLQRRQRVTRALRGHATIRIALHPRDLSPSTRAQVAALFDRMHRDGWEPASLDEAVAQS